MFTGKSQRDKIALLNQNSDVAPKSRPNLFIIGAMKAGTTSLHNYLNAHPEIFMCEPKEPCYFVHPKELNWPQIEKLKLWNNEERYLDLFKNSRNAKIIGESSTPYTKFPAVNDVPRRIYQFNPEARFIYVLRDPIERTISHYLHEVRRGNEHNDMMTAIEQNLLYRNISDYEKQLWQFLNYFDRDRFLIFTFEELVADTPRTVKQVFDWLGINSSFEPLNLVQKSHVTPEKFYQKGRLYRLRYTWPFSSIANLLPSGVRKAGLRNLIREVDRKDELADKQRVVDYLRPIQQSQVKSLSHLLRRDFPEWKTLWDAKGE
jgi:hypothetical protein